MKVLKKKLERSFSRISPAILALSLVVLFFWKFFLRGFVPLPADFVVGTYYPWLDYKWGYEVGVPVKNPITTDVVSFTYPMRTLAVELLKRGELPLWNPYILTGVPLLANFQSAPFTFTNIFYFVFDKVTAWSLQVISQHFFAIVFTYVLLRKWGLSKPSSLFGGLVFAFSGFNLIWSQWNSHTLSASFIPLLILFTDRFLTEGNGLFGVLFSLSLFVQILSGYPQVTFYTALAVALFCVVNFKRDVLLFKRLVLLFVFALLGLGLAAFQIFPAIELLGQSQRAVEPLEKSLAFLPWSKIITFIAPDYFGNHATKNYWGPGDYTTTTGFVGVIAFVFAFYALKFFKEKRVLFAFLLLLVSLVLSFPTPPAVLIWSKGFFGLQAASMHRALVLFTFSVSLLSSFGFENFLDKRFTSNFFPLIPPVLILIIFGSYSVLSFLFNEPAFMGLPLIDKWQAYVSLRNLVLPTFFWIAITVVLYLQRKKLLGRRFLILSIFFLATLELFRFGWKFTPFSKKELVYPQTPVIKFLEGRQRPFRVTTTNVIPINIKMAYRLESLEGYDAVYPVRIAKLIAVMNSNRIDASPQGRYGTVSNLESKILDLVNTKYFLELKRDSKGTPNMEGDISRIFKGDKYKLVFEDRTTVVLENKGTFPRAFVVYDWERVEDESSVLQKLFDPDFPLGDKVILAESGYKSPPDRRKGVFNVSYQIYSEQESGLNVETDKDGLLFVSDLYYPGWKVFVDGREEKILKADYAFRAVAIPKGRHFVRFIYKPKSFFEGLMLSTASLFLLVLLFLYFLYNRDHKRLAVYE